jgi:hypothetical protein
MDESKSEVVSSIALDHAMHPRRLGRAKDADGRARITGPRGEITPILRGGAGKRIAEDMGVPFCGSIPIDPKIAEAGDEGSVYVRHFAGSPAAGIMREIVRTIIDRRGRRPEAGEPAASNGRKI